MGLLYYIYLFIHLFIFWTFTHCYPWLKGCYSVSETVPGVCRCIGTCWFFPSQSMLCVQVSSKTAHFSTRYGAKLQSNARGIPGGVGDFWNWLEHYDGIICLSNFQICQLYRVTIPFKMKLLWQNFCVSAIYQSKKKDSFMNFFLTLSEVTGLTEISIAK